MTIPTLIVRSLRIGVLLGACVIASTVTADAQRSNFLTPQRGVLGQEQAQHAYFTLLKRKLLYPEPGLSLASGVWFSAYSSATAVRIIFDRETQQFHLHGTRESQSIWRSFTYWSSGTDAATRRAILKNHGEPAKPQDIEVEHCKISLPTLAAERTVWLWDTALLNMRPTDRTLMPDPESKQYHISTRVGTGTMRGPTSDSTNGYIRSSLYALRDLCWKGATPRRLDQLEKSLQRTQTALSVDLYGKGYAWRELQATSFAAGMSVYEELARR